MKSIQYLIIIIIISCGYIDQLHSTEKLSAQEQIAQYNKILNTAFHASIHTDEQAHNFINATITEMNALKTIFHTDTVDGINTALQALSKKQTDAQSQSNEVIVQLKKLIEEKTAASQRMFNTMKDNISSMNQFLQTTSLHTTVSAHINRFNQLNIENKSHRKDALEIHAQLYKMFIDETRKRKQREHEQKIAEQQQKQYKAALDNMIKATGISNINQLNVVANTLKKAHKLLGNDPNKFSEEKQTLESFIAQTNQEIKTTQTETKELQEDLNFVISADIDMMIDSLIIQAQTAHLKIQSAISTALKKTIMLPVDSPDKQKDFIKSLLQGKSLHAQLADLKQILATFYESTNK